MELVTPQQAEQIKHEEFGAKVAETKRKKDMRDMINERQKRLDEQEKDNDYDE